MLISFTDDSWDKAGLDGRDELEDPLDDALLEADLGEVTGGGSGRGQIDIAVTLHDEQQFEDALQLMRTVLIENGAPSDTKITRFDPEEKEYSLHP
jgi:hypothetical protein